MPAVSMFNITAGNPQSVGSGETSFAFDTTTNTMKCLKNGSTLYELVEKDATQTLTAKTLTAPVINDPTGASSLVAAGSTLTLTAATHSGKTIALNTASGSVVTLPTSTGGGAVYRFLVTVTATSNSHIIQVGNATDEFRGFVYQDASEATAPNTWWAADNDDTITLNRSTTGLAAQGEYFEIVDATSGHYFVRGFSQASGIEATPFSNAVS